MIALTSVSVALDVQSKVATSTSYDPSKSVQKEVSTDSHSEETSQSTGGAGEPGAVSNTGLSVNTGSSAGGGNTSSTTEDKSEFTNAIASTVETTTTPAGQEQVVSAAVGLPRSHFAELYMQMNSGAKEPDEETLRKSAEPELARVKHQVQSACGLKSDDNIYVDLYADAPVQAPTDLTLGPPGSPSVTLINHIKEIAIGALAMVSLFMVSMMVRKGSPTPVALAAGAGSGDVRETPIFGSPEDEIAAVAGDAQNAMDGMELDDEAMKSQQVVEQVTTMVKENPDAAATLVKRWLNRT
jgi:flagellar biosynthesis/type III secretory pathway M-ring protein FliF/YscJ